MRRSLRYKQVQARQEAERQTAADQQAIQEIAKAMGLVAIELSESQGDQNNGDDND